MKGVVAIFVLPYEIDDLAITLYSLKRNAVFVGSQTVFKVDICLCLSSLMTDWESSVLSKEFIKQRVTTLCSVYLDWCDWNLYIEKSDAILGCVSHRRKVWKENDDASFFLWLDTDIFFRDVTLSCLCEGVRLIVDQGNERFLLTPQVVRQWDSSWDVLVNQKFIDEPIGYSRNTCIHYDVLTTREDIAIQESNEFKFAGGWCSVISKKLLDIIGIPASFGHYGYEDTYIMECAYLLVRQGIAVRQFIMHNVIVGEIYRYRLSGTFKEYISSIDRKDEFRKIAAEAFRGELSNFREKVALREL